VLVLKIIFLNKKYYFNVFLNKKYFKKQHLKNIIFMWCMRQFYIMHEQIYTEFKAHKKINKGNSYQQ
jgi:hypothetical protein